MDVVKRKLQAATGIPASNMKIRLGGYNQFVMIDTTSNIRVGSSGITSGALLRAFAPAGANVTDSPPACAQPSTRWTPASCSPSHSSDLPIGFAPFMMHSSISVVR